MIEDARSLIFDLDGTLYEDTDHFEFYAHLLKQKLPADKQGLFQTDYEKVLQGLHPLTIGTAYDLRENVILTIDPYTNRAASVLNWEGEEWLDQQVQIKYPDPVEFDFEHIIAIGDGWWLPYSVAVHYGVSLEDCHKCYMQTKDYMVSDQFSLTHTHGLREALEEWKKDKTLILLTNSEEYDVQNLLSELGLKNMFHETITSAKKPALTLSHFKRILEGYNLLPEQAVSIGDNFMNEIAPALITDMKGILIQPTTVPYKHPNLQVVSTLREIIPQIKRSDSY
ncbi:HAD family hydrolase [Halobacillus sp. Marseille-Q1614]|uniref:HAD family hydrolase n=1 Tax=Halobacillus sp. Marseille-Q1614 TaxID=2709134 RepID=UPI001570C507|nr:HAD family hydrolase [Halobacillus sp. Marseille-Q1614]